jgi:hypothetical protein
MQRCGIVGVQPDDIRSVTCVKESEEERQEELKQRQQQQPPPAWSSAVTTQVPATTTAVQQQAPVTGGELAVPKQPGGPLTTTISRLVTCLHQSCAGVCICGLCAGVCTHDVTCTPAPAPAPATQGVSTRRLPPCSRQRSCVCRPSAQL